jgi:hypothetical protein
LNAQTNATGAPVRFKRNTRPLRALFDQHGIVRGTHRLPSEEGFQQLARAVVHARSWAEYCRNGWLNYERILRPTVD